MMNRILLVISCAAFISLTACHGNESANSSSEKTDSSYAIIGKVTGQDSGTIYLIHRQTAKIDSIELDHGYFKFNGKADTAEICTISVNNHYKLFFLENGKISMLIKKDSVRYALIGGTKTQDEYSYFQNQLSSPINDRMKVVEKEYDIADTNRNRKVMDSLDKVYDNLVEEKKQMIFDYTKAHPGSFISAYEISENFSDNPRLSQLDSLYSLLDVNVRNSYFGKIIANTLVKEKLTAIGKQAPDFVSKNAGGDPVSLASFKGTYLLVDFWASWCGPCRQENPNVVRAYKEFHNKGFNILGVSLDKTKPEWIAAVKKDGLAWTQVSDLKGWKSDVVSLYGVQSIPTNYLLDKNGVIIAKGLRGDDLDKDLAEVLH